MSEEMSDSNPTIPEQTKNNSMSIEIEHDDSVESEGAENIRVIALDHLNNEMTAESNSEDVTDGRKKRVNDSNNFANNKVIAEGLMDIALLSANANQLRFLISYNKRAPTYYISFGLVITSLCLQVIVGIMLIFKRSMRKWNNPKRFIRLNELLVGSVFVVTVVNVLLAAFTTTPDAKPN